MPFSPRAAGVLFKFVYLSVPSLRNYEPVNRLQRLQEAERDALEIFEVNGWPPRAYCYGHLLELTGHDGSRHLMVSRCPNASEMRMPDEPFDSSALPHLDLEVAEVA